MTVPASPASVTQRNALSIRATIIGVAAVAFGSVLIAGLAMMVRVVPNAERLTRRGNAARDDYTARSVVAAQLDSSMSDLWRLARRAKLAPIPPSLSPSVDCVSKTLYEEPANPRRAGPS